MSSTLEIFVRQSRNIGAAAVMMAVSALTVGFGGAQPAAAGLCCATQCVSAQGLSQTTTINTATQQWVFKAFQACGRAYANPKNAASVKAPKCEPMIGGGMRCGFCARPCQASASGGSGRGGAQRGGTLKRYNFRYSIRNTAKVTVRFRLPDGKVYRVTKGQRRNFFINRRMAKAPRLHVLNSGRTYTLKPGAHKFWWNKSAGRVGFDQRYRTD